MPAGETHEKVRVGIIGAGGVARKIHIPGFRKLPDVELAAVCDPDEEAARAAGVPRVYADYRELLRDAAVDAVVVSSPNHLHHEIAIAALKARKHVLCEKPLALDAAQASEMLDAARKAGVVHMTAFTYRYTPSVRYLKHLADQGELGRIQSVRAAYLMALAGHVTGWRSSRALAGSGALADIGSHLIHLALDIAGGIGALSGSVRKFRDDPSSDVDDWAGFVAEFRSGATGTFEISRVCPGRGADITENMFVEVYGSAGSTVFSLQDPFGIQAALGEDGRNPERPLTRRAIPEEWRKLPGSPRRVEDDEPRWGYRFDQAYEFVENIRRGTVRTTSFEDGLRCQRVLDAVLDSSEKRAWVSLPRD